jgi:hypothetical protein
MKRSDKEGRERGMGEIGGNGRRKGKGKRMGWELRRIHYKRGMGKGRERTFFTFLRRGVDSDEGGGYGEGGERQVKRRGKKGKWRGRDKGKVMGIGRVKWKGRVQ